MQERRRLWMMGSIVGARQSIVQNAHESRGCLWGERSMSAKHSPATRTAICPPLPPVVHSEMR